MAETFTLNPIADYRNEGWTFTGAFSSLWASWVSGGPDTNYASIPGTKGRASVTFAQDLTTGNVPWGSGIESVTVYVRAANTDGASRLSVQLGCQVDTGKTYQRTIPLTATPTNYTVATLTGCPNELTWDRSILNHLVLQLFSYSTTAAALRVYGVWCVINYRTQHSLVVTAPTGSIVGSSPVCAWTYSQSDGDVQESAIYKIFTALQVQNPHFNPDFSPATYPAAQSYTVVAGDTLYSIAAKLMGDGRDWPQIYEASSLATTSLQVGQRLTVPGVGVVNGDVSLITLPFGLAPDNYVFYVQITSDHGVESPWAYRAFTVVRSQPGTPGGNPVPTLEGGVGTGGGGSFESEICDPAQSNVYMSLVDGSNLLGIEQADFGSSADSIGWIGTNCSLAVDQTVGVIFPGGVSMKMTASSAATMSAVTDFVEVQPGTPITGSFQSLAVTTGRSVTMNILFFDASYTSLGGTITATGADVTGTWTLVQGTGTTPATAAYAQLQLVVTSPANGEAHDVDHMGLMYGTNAAWSNGGHASRNILTTAQSVADDPSTSPEPWTAIGGTTYSRVANTGIGADTAKAFKMLYAGIAPGISFVATGTAFTDTTTSASFTLNKPAGAVTGDVLVAYVSTIASGNPGVVVTPPTGWTLVNWTYNGSVGLSVLMRDALTADPSTWTGAVTQGATQLDKRAVVVAYRGAAPIAYQLNAEGATNSTSGSTVITTPTVYNGDANAWRLSAFAVNDNAAAGTMTANIANPATPQISFVGKSTVASSVSSSSTFSFNRPPNIVSGDLMVAAVYAATASSVSTPTGWTLVRSTVDATHVQSMTIFKRTATGAESASWSGSFTPNASAWSGQVVAYRNADVAANQFIAEGSSTVGATTSITTASVTNTNSNAWSLSIFGVEVNGNAYTTSSETIERAEDHTGSYNPNAYLSFWDSGSPISTGTRQRTGQANGVNWWSGANVGRQASWIGLIKPLPTPPAPGANETERHDGTTGGVNPWLTLEVNDSNGVAATGNQVVYGTFTPGSGTATTGTACFLGFLIPASSANTILVPGQAGATMKDIVNISKVSPDVYARCGNQMTAQASFLGSVAGSASLTLYSYVGAELVSTQISSPQSFNTTTWTKVAAQFVLTKNVTGVQLGVSATTLSANDYVLYNKASIAYGASNVFRMGTGLAAHPIFDRPEIEFKEDLGQGYGPWMPLFGADAGAVTLTYDNLSGLCQFVEQTMTPLSNRTYRARTISYGLAGDTFVSTFGPNGAEVTLVATDFWLKDMTNQSLSMPLKVYRDGSSGPSAGSGGLAVTRADSSAIMQPLGALLPVVVSDGYKGNTISLTVICERQQMANLKALIDSGHTLLLQSNVDGAWWVRPTGSIANVLQPTGKMTTNPLRFVTLTFTEVAPES